MMNHSTDGLTNQATDGQQPAAQCGCAEEAPKEANQAERTIAILGYAKDQLNGQQRELEILRAQVGTMNLIAHIVGGQHNRISAIGGCQSYAVPDISWEITHEIERLKQAEQLRRDEQKATSQPAQDLPVSKDKIDILKKQLQQAIYEENAQKVYNKTSPVYDNTTR